MLFLLFKKARGIASEFPSYPTQMSPNTSHVIKRSLFDSDLKSVSQFYKGYRNRLRALGIISLVLFITTSVLIPSIISDWTISFVLYFFMFMIGSISIGLSLKTMLIRKRIADTLNEGTGIEVQGTAYKNRAGRNVMAWNIGPISMMSTVETVNMIQEGTQVKVLCIPRMNIVLSINNIGLTHGARMTYPPNLEAEAASEQILSQEAEEEEKIHAIEATIDMSMKSDKRLTKLKELRDKGLITDQDYEKKKQEILIEI